MILYFGFVKILYHILCQDTRDFHLEPCQDSLLSYFVLYNDSLLHAQSKILTMCFTIDLYYALCQDSLTFILSEFWTIYSATMVQ